MLKRSESPTEIKNKLNNKNSQEDTSRKSQEMDLFKLESLSASVPLPGRLEKGTILEGFN